MAREWNPDKMLSSLTEEADVFDLSTKQQAEKMFRDNVAHATDSIIWLARYSENEKIRMDASRYIVDRILGKPGETGGKDVFDKFLEELNAESGAQ